ncbi:MAG: tetratricopeptide repeat protein [Woeseiaceae bacterium]|nr:tetratricopeptide repeat protein [Woeseiaceae bacterium]
MRHLLFIAAIVGWLFASFALSPVAYADEETPDEAGKHLIEAEAALQADEYLKAAQEYRKAAELSDRIQIARRATRTAFGFGFNAEALRAAQRWLELDEDSDEATAYIAQIQLRLGNIRESKQAFETLMERSDQPGDEQLVALLPAFSEEDPALVDKLVRLLARPYPESALAQYAMAATALQAGDLEYASERARKAVEIDPEWLKPKLLYARTMLISGDIEGAIDYTARIIGDDPNPDPDARLDLALMLMSANRDEDALGQVEQVLLEQSGRFDALRLRAIINFRLNNLDLAHDDFQMILASGRYTMDANYYLARIADIRSDLDMAIQLYSRVESGQFVIASQRRASALLAFRKDSPDQALDRLDEFADDHPGFAVDMALTKAQLLTSLDRFDDALSAYDRVLEFRPDDEYVALGRAELILRMGRIDDAVSAYRQAVRQWPDSAMTLNALGYTLADRTNELREAEKLIRKALRIDPESAAIIDSLGWVLFKRGRPAEALEQLELAYEMFPDPEVAAHLVEVLAALERDDEALEVLTAAEEQNPDSEFLQDVRGRIFPDAP